jgi:hypothetical protein
MASVLLRHSYRSKDHLLRLANSTLLELSKRASNGLIHDSYSALGLFSHPNAASPVINQLVTLRRQFSSSGRPLYSVESPLKTPRAASNTQEVVKTNDTTVRKALNFLNKSTSRLDKYKYHHHHRRCKTEETQALFFC